MSNIYYSVFGLRKNLTFIAIKIYVSGANSMILDITPLHDDGNMCIEDPIYSYTNWIGRNYEMMFSDSWGFEFTSRDSEIVIGLGYINVEYLLERYHGIKINTIEANSGADILDTIKSEIMSKRPVMISTFIQNIPWRASSATEIGRWHCFLIIGYDCENFYCIDPYFNKNINKFNIENFKRTHIGNYITLELVHEEYTDIDWRCIVENTLVKFRKTNGTYDSMINFANYLGHMENLVCHFDGNELINNLVRQLNSILNSRLNYAKVLRYISIALGIPVLGRYTIKLQRASLMWNKAKGLITKAILVNKIDNSLYNRIEHNIREVANYEKEIVDELCGLVRDENSLCKSTDTTISSCTIVHNIINDYKFIDLSSFLNIIAFGTSVSDLCPAKFTIRNGYLYAENLPLNEELEVGDMKFDSTRIRGDCYDSMKCNGEAIPCPEGLYDYIMFLGCGEVGHQSDEVTIEYEGGKTEKMPIELSDFWSNINFFGEKFAWKGRYVKVAGGKRELLQREVYLYAQKYQLSNQDIVKSIHLPENPFIHLFAITLGKK